MTPTTDDNRHPGRGEPPALTGRERDRFAEHLRTAAEAGGPDLADLIDPDVVVADDADSTTDDVDRVRRLLADPDGADVLSGLVWKRVGPRLASGGIDPAQVRPAADAVLAELCGDRRLYRSEYRAVVRQVAEAMRVALGRAGGARWPEFRRAAPAAADAYAMTAFAGRTATEVAQLEGLTAEQVEGLLKAADKWVRPRPARRWRWWLAAVLVVAAGGGVWLAIRPVSPADGPSVAPAPAPAAATDDVIEASYTEVLRAYAPADKVEHFKAGDPVTVASKRLASVIRVHTVADGLELLFLVEWTGSDSPPHPLVRYTFWSSDPKVRPRSGFMLLRQARPGTSWTAQTSFPYRRIEAYEHYRVETVRAAALTRDDTAGLTAAVAWDRKHGESPDVLHAAWAKWLLDERTLDLDVRYELFTAVGGRDTWARP